MASQRCPNCGHSQDTRIYTSGTKVPCSSCGLTMEVVREDVSVLKAAAIAAAPPPPAAPVGPHASTFGGPLRATIAVSADETIAVNAAAGDEASATVVRASVKIPGYELLHVLGRGGMGEVWRARQLSLNREVAVKLLAPDLAKDAAFIKRFEKEAAALAALGHAHVVQIIDRGQADGIYFFAMEFVSGRSLRDRMDERALTTAETLRCIVQIARAIAFAHERGVVHRDLKPENILLAADDQVKVADFGLAGMSDQRFNVTQSAMTMGTMNYMAPEQRKDAKNVDGRADLYSLGVMLYEMLVGDVPVGRFKLPSEINPSLSPRLDAVVTHALETDPAARYQNATEIVRDIEALQSTISLPSAEAGSSAAPVPSPPPAPVSSIPAAEAPRAPSKVERESGIGLAGRGLRAMVLGSLLFLGLGVVLQAFFHIQLFSVDDHGLTIGLVPHKPPEPASDLAVGEHPTHEASVALPPDTNRDLNITLKTIVDPQSPVAVVQSDLSPGHDGSLVVFNGEWSSGPHGLTARVFDRLQKSGARPRASLEEPSFHLADLTAEVKVSIDDVGLAGYERKHPPTAFLNFHARDVVLQLSMELGASPVYHGTWKEKDAEGESATHEFIDPDLDDLRPPPPRTEVGLKLVIKRGYLTAFANDKPILSRAVKLPERFNGAVGRVGVGCEEAVCTFGDFRIEGEAEHDRDLGDDTHVHSMTAP